MNEAIDDEATPAAPPRRTVLDPVRDLYRRGVGAIARTGGDNVALGLLAAGAAIGAVSWLMARQRAARGRRTR